MTLTDFQIGGVIVGAVGLVLTGGAIIYRQGLLIGEIKLKVNTLWDLQIRRGMTEILSKGLGTVNSPLTISPETIELARPLYANFIDEMRKVYRGMKKRHEDRELFFELERVFGDRLAVEVCPKLGLHMGGCLHIAKALIREASEDPPSGADRL